MKTRTIIVWSIAGLANAGSLLYALFWYLNPKMPSTGDFANDSSYLDLMRAAVLSYMLASVWNIFQLAVTTLIFSVRNPDRPIPMLNLGWAFMMLPLVGTMAFLFGGVWFSIPACFILCFGAYRDMKTGAQKLMQKVEGE